MKDLWKAMVDWLRADATLVSLTEHLAADLRIYAWSPDSELKVPSLIVDFGPQELLAGRTVYDTKARIESYGSSIFTSESIIERVRALLVDATTADKRCHGPVGAISNATVTIKSCELGTISTPVWNQDMRYWSHELSVRVIWAFV